MEKLILEERKRLSVSDVTEVAAFSEKEIKLIARDKSRITVRGDGLKIASFSKDNGAFLCDGIITEIKFGNKKDFFGKLFK